MVAETITILMTDTDGIYVDGTVGSGGHSEAIGNRLSPKGRLVCLDKDPAAIKFSKERLGFLGERATLLNANYAELDKILRDLNLKKVNGVVLDLGLSSYQLERSGRGFSFMRDEPLDMRMNPNDELTAHKLVNELPVMEIKKIIKEFGEEKKAGLIAGRIGKERIKKGISSSKELADLVRSVFPSSRHSSIDPATKTFQAFRIAVNSELKNLEDFLGLITPIVKKGGRLVFLSYHSLEDRRIKQKMKIWEKGCTCPPDLPKCVCGNKPVFRRLFKKGIRPDEAEVSNNPRARSAILRAAERI